MSCKKTNFLYCDELIEKFEEVVRNPKKTQSKKLYTGVDLGTACIVIAVLDENYEPVAGAYRYANVVKDGMVVDYLGAIKIVRELKEEIEKKLGQKLLYAASAIPPGTDYLDSGAIKNVIQAAGFEMTNMLDEPAAANMVLKMQNGAVVDIGGGTTGTSVLKDGVVKEILDEPTGGTHFSLVIAGAYGTSFEKAELMKRDLTKHKELLPVLQPVVEKVATIIKKHISSYEVKEIVLVGGTACLTGIEEIIEKNIGVYTHKPKNPMFVTPLGIALSCKWEE